MKMPAIPVLTATGVGKSFDGIAALRWSDTATLDAMPGEIHGIVGENGAGKSTLMSILAGLTAHDRGELRLSQHAYAPSSPSDSRHLGVEIVLQEPGLIASLSVVDNFFLGRSTGSRLGGLRPGSVRRVREALQPFVADVDPRRAAGTLSLEQQKLVEIARAVYFRPKVLIVDEMSACLSRSALERLFQILHAESDRGAAILYISHYLEEVARLCDRVTVFRDGQIVATLPKGDFDEARLANLMVGREMAHHLYRDDRVARPSMAPMLVVEGLSNPAYSDVNLAVGAGEIVGIGGLVGCGSEELARTIFGATKATAGRMTLEGTPYRPRGPRQAIARRVAYVVPDRDREGLLLRLPIATNITLASFARLFPAGILRRRREVAVSNRLIEQLSIRCLGADQAPLGLSGGNRQKVVLARWLLADPRLLVLHNPTRGIDIGAKAEIYRLMVDLADRGMAILLISDELPELLGMSDRILIMRRGRIEHETVRDLGPTEDELITYMV